MIGPHRGKELELMLAGKKHLAIFHDALVDGQPIPESIIPEKSFAPYIAGGNLKRSASILSSMKDRNPVQYVCFTTPQNEWRADAFFWIHQECAEGRRPFDDAYEFFVGRLLGYEESDIQHFIEHQKSFRCTIRA